MINFLIIEEYFAAADNRFLPAIRTFSDAQRLAPFADRWARDPRPWARKQVLDYLEMPLDVPGHQTVVKRLFKPREAARDDELMAAFMAAFDRLVRRVRKTRYQYDWKTRKSWTEETLVSPRNTLPPGLRIRQNPRTLEPVPYQSPDKPLRLFSYHTRNYLRRRAWRYFRRMGFQRPGDYVAAVCRFLALYRDEDLAKGENLIDSWGLIHACFFEHAAIEFTAAHTRLAEGHALGELSPAPMFPQLWQTPDAARSLLGLVGAARSRPVRVWAVQLLRRDHMQNLAGLSPVELLPLLDHADEELQQFGAQLLENAAGLATLPVAQWLRLLQTRSLIALETIARVMQRHVDPSRLSLFEAVTMANNAAVPIARLGLAFLQARVIATAPERQGISNLAKAKSPRVAGDIARWALGHLGTREHYQVDQVIRFFDSLLAEAREAAWAWLTPTPGAPHPDGDSPGWNDAALWSRLLETPWLDLKLRLVEVLEKRASLPGASAADLAPLWSGVLLNIHRGGRRKLTALRQISDALRADPANAETLIPVLAAAIRSVRAPEARAGLSAIVGAVAARPDVAPLVAQHLPELNLNPEAASA